MTSLALAALMFPVDMFEAMRAPDGVWNKLQMRPASDRQYRMQFHWMTMGMVVFASIVMLSYSSFSDTPVSHVHPSAAPTTPAPSRVPSKTPSKAPTTSVPSISPSVTAG